MRRPLIAGNWKMNLRRRSAVALAEGVVSRSAMIDGVDLAVCPPSCYLDAVGLAQLPGRRSPWRSKRLSRAGRRLYRGTQRRNAS